MIDRKKRSSYFKIDLNVINGFDRVDIRFGEGFWDGRSVLARRLKRAKAV